MNQRDKDHVDYERSERSVFVGNIPYEATEDQLKDIFNEVGSVVSFRLVFDRESGKPKGYGFAEYQDQETAMSAMRNLNGRELHGRPLRVDHATSEKNRNPFPVSDEVGSIRLGGPPVESEYGEPCASQEAPEAISKAVASLPPEQMFELMRQMKQCIQNNPVEARNMLLQNPQLAYALLQAQVVMRIVDPEIAMKMLHRPNASQPLIPAGDVPNVEKDMKLPGNGISGFPDRMEPMDIGRNERFAPPPGRMGRDPTIGIERVPVDGPMIVERRFDVPPHRMIHPGDVGRPPSPERFARGEPPRQPPIDFPPDRAQRNRDPRAGGRGGRSSLERGGGLSPHDHPVMMPGRAPPAADRFPIDQPVMLEGNGGPSTASLTDPRRGGGNPPTSIPQIPPHMASKLAAGEEDQEKANLIMQVLQLTPAQIKLLPEDQRKNILALKTNFGL